MTRVGNEIYNAMLMVAGVVISRHVEIAIPANSANRVGATLIDFLVTANSTVRLFEADAKLGITSITQANPAVITTDAEHGLVTGQNVDIRGSNSGVTVDGTRTATVVSPTTFSVPVNNTGAAGTTGSVLVDTSPLSGIYDLQTASLARSHLRLGDGSSIIVIAAPGKGIWLASQVSTSAGSGLCKAVEIEDRLYASSDAP